MAKMSLQGIRSSLGTRNFRLLFTGQLVSLVGDGVMTLALPLLVRQLTGSTADMGIVIAARMIPMVVLLVFGGALTDRMSRRSAMLISDSGRCVVALVMGFAALHGAATMPLLVTAAAGFGVFDALFYPASTALIPELLGPEQLAPANSLLQMSRTLAGQMLGPALGGLLSVAIGPSWCVVIDGASFAVSALFLLAMSPTPRPEPTGAHVLHDIAEGIRFCARQPWLIWTLFIAALANAAVFSPSAVLVIVLLKQDLGAGNGIVGLAFAAVGLGGFVGALLAGVLPLPKRRIAVMWVVWTAADLTVLGVGLSPDVAAVLLFSLLAGPLLLYGQVLWESMLQREVPREMLGRVSSVDWTLSLGLAPIGVIVAAQVAQHVGPRPTLVVPAIAISVLSIALLLGVRSITAIDRRPTGETATEPLVQD